MRSFGKDQTRYSVLSDVVKNKRKSILTFSLYYVYYYEVLLNKTIAVLNHIDFLNYFGNFLKTLSKEGDNERREKV